MKLNICSIDGEMYIYIYIYISIHDDLYADNELISSMYNYVIIAFFDQENMNSKEKEISQQRNQPAPFQVAISEEASSASR